MIGDNVEATEIIITHIPSSHGLHMMSVSNYILHRQVTKLFFLKFSFLKGSSYIQ
jgi:hypothetical protein